MRAKERQQGRFVSLSGLHKERGRPGDLYELKILDEQGRPISHLMEWFRLRKEPGPNRTRQTYLDLLLPFVGHQLRQGYIWNADPKQIRTQITQFLQEGLACAVRPDRDHEGMLWEPSAATPLSESSVRGFLAAARDFYDTMIDAGYYRFPNPLRSALLVHEKQEWLRSIENAGAPEHAGIKDASWEEYRQHPTAFFRQTNATEWRPELPLLKEKTQQCLQNAIHTMIEQAPSQREKVILLLLRYTGARPHEILTLTAGGCRKAPDVLSAVVVNKRSRGREVKTIHFTDLVEREMTIYLRTERAKYDPQGRKHLEDLDDRDPIFLTEQGKPYSYGAFRYHWRKLYAPVTKRYKVTFRLYDLRHLFVTQYIQRAKIDAAGDGVKLAEAKEGLQLLMAWRSPMTMKAYDHSFQKAEGLARLAEVHRDMDQELTSPPPLPADTVEHDQRAKISETPVHGEYSSIIDEDEDDLLTWVRHH
jgi:hypothetical protein